MSPVKSKAVSCRAKYGFCGCLGVRSSTWPRLECLGRMLIRRWMLRLNPRRLGSEETSGRHGQEQTRTLIQRAPKQSHVSCRLHTSDNANTLTRLLHVVHKTPPLYVFRPSCHQQGRLQVSRPSWPDKHPQPQAKCGFLTTTTDRMRQPSKGDNLRALNRAPIVESSHPRPWCNPNISYRRFWD